MSDTTNVMKNTSKYCISYQAYFTGHQAESLGLVTRLPSRVKRSWIGLEFKEKVIPSTLVGYASGHYLVVTMFERALRRNDVLLNLQASLLDVVGFMKAKFRFNRSEGKATVLCRDGSYAIFQVVRVDHVST